MADLHASLSAQGFTRDDIPKAPFYAIKCGFYLRHSWFQRDTDNMIKIVLDVLSRYFDINDNRMVSNQIYRRGLKGGPDMNELVYFAIEPVFKRKEELIVDYEELPWNKILNTKS